MATGKRSVASARARTKSDNEGRRRATESSTLRLAEAIRGAAPSVCTPSARQVAAVAGLRMPPTGRDATGAHGAAEFH